MFAVKERSRTSPQSHHLVPAHPAKAPERGPPARAGMWHASRSGSPESAISYTARDLTSLEPTGDKKKSDDNGGPGVPDGLQKFVPKTSNGKAEGSAVGMVSVEKPLQPDWDNGFDRDVAARFGGGQRHQSVEELGKNLKIDTTKESTRISQLIIGGHGNRNMLAAGSGDGPDTSDALNIKESNKATWLPFFQRDKFFGQGEIWLISCNVGNGPIPQLMADQSGSVVYAYTRTAFSTEPSPFTPGP